MEREGETGFKNDKYGTTKLVTDPIDLLGGNIYRKLGPMLLKPRIYQIIQKIPGV